jgi:hypothetical protein
MDETDHTSPLHVRLTSVGQPLQHGSQHGAGTEPENLAHQPALSQNGATTETMTRTLEAVYPPASAEFPFLHSAQGGLLDVDWWNNASTLNAWDHLPFLNDVALQDLMA